MLIKNIYTPIQRETSYALICQKFNSIGMFLFIFLCAFTISYILYITNKYHMYVSTHTLNMYIHMSSNNWRQYLKLPSFAFK